MTADQIKSMDPYTIAEALAAQTLRLAECIRSNQPTDASTAGTIRNISASAQHALVCARGALDQSSPDTETAMFLIACADGAVSLIGSLLAAPDDPFVQKMIEPFIPCETKVTT